MDYWMYQHRWDMTIVYVLIALGALYTALMIYEAMKWCCGGGVGFRTPNTPNTHPHPLNYHSSDNKSSSPDSCHTVSNDKNFVLAVEGNISSGKSTFCQALHTVRKDDVSVIFEMVNDVLLQTFLANPKEYAKVLQLVRMIRRLHELDLTRYSSILKTVLDRSVGGDVFFALVHFLTGNMSYTDMLIYTKEMELNDFFGMMKRRSLNAFLYLHSDPHTCRERVEHRGNVDRDTKEDYLSDISNVHFYGMLWIISKRQIPVYVTTCQHLLADDESTQTKKACDLYYSIESKQYQPATIDFQPSTTITTIGDSDHTSVITWDDPTDLQPLAADRLTLLPKEWRWVHTQAWKDRVMAQLSKPGTSRHHVLFVRSSSSTGERQLHPTMFNFFQQLDSWSTFLSTFDPKRESMGIVAKSDEVVDQHMVIDHKNGACVNNTVSDPSTGCMDVKTDIAQTDHSIKSRTSRTSSQSTHPMTLRSHRPLCSSDS